MNDCIRDNILKQADACAFVRANCNDYSSYFNFIDFFYCDLDQSLPLTVICSIFFGILVFNFLAAVADSYLAPALETISKKLQLSETIAGITVLAFAASAPDVITGIVAGGRAETGVRVVIGGLFGACLFCVTVVLAGCILGSGHIQAEKNALFRDIGFLMITMIYFLAISALDAITPAWACGFFVIYAIFFAYVLFQERSIGKASIHDSLKEDVLVIDVDTPSQVFANSGSNLLSSQLLVNQQDTTQSPIKKGSSGSLNKSNFATGMKSSGALNGLKSFFGIATTSKGNNPTKPGPKVSPKNNPANQSAHDIRQKFASHQMIKEIKSVGHQDLQASVKQSAFAIGMQSSIGASLLKIHVRNSWRRMPTNRTIQKAPSHYHPDLPIKSVYELSARFDSFLSEEDLDKDESTVKTLLRYINIPILFIGDITMPPFEEDRWNRYMAAATPIFGILFMLSELGLVQNYLHVWYFWAIYGFISFTLSLIILIKGKDVNLGTKYPGIFSFAALVVAMFWLNLVSGLIVDFLTFIQVVTGLSMYFLSITLLSWGNSLEDFFVNYAISRKGFGKTALGGVYGSQIFAVLIGFGGGIFRLTLTSPVELNLYDFTKDDIRENIMTLFLLGASLLVLVLTLVAGKFNDWVMDRKIVIFTLVFYAIFTVAITLIAFA